ncbi:hypothetical protein DW322_16425 [Rhodococcus rhodnii]|uniref:Sensory transduction regulator n=2 Tax=Rhodococcus rhodnii TaxID=38312 RepID=R7WPL4_9NOCA|nr:hypothetical protein [Rhodococcus rhodnii]EOM77256.1 hypothetical protein Rrhod_1378 [Rhodococcus rhodnii LMG 5362]TXG91494.1 hypothetical protein DW322_16425 [Rhodococcus rhodnii]
MSDAAQTLLARTEAALAPLGAVERADDGSLRFEYSGALCSVSAMTLTDGLDVLALTCVLAWDVPASDAVPQRIATLNADIQFGTVLAVDRGETVDVILRYTFPAGGLDDTALTTMVLLVLSATADARETLA